MSKPDYNNPQPGDKFRLKSGQWVEVLKVEADGITLRNLSKSEVTALLIYGQ